MTTTLAKIFYDKNTGAVTRWVVRDGKNEDDNYTMHTEAPGEKSLMLLRSQVSDLNVIQAFVNNVTGLSPAKTNFAIVEMDGTVSAIRAAYVQPPASQLQEIVVAKDANAMVGGKYLGGAFVAKPPDPPNPNWPVFEQIAPDIKP